jgi:hypothetical protein
MRLPVHAQTPLEQACPVPQASPQAPQLASLELVSTHTPVPQSLSGGVQLIGGASIAGPSSPPPSAMEPSAGGGGGVSVPPQPTAAVAASTSKAKAKRVRVASRTLEG